MNKKELILKQAELLDKSLKNSEQIQKTHNRIKKIEKILEENMELTWQYEKFKGDLAIYAFCPICEYGYCPSQLNHETMQSELKFQHKFCPECGTYLYSDAENVYVVWNERDIVDYIKEKEDKRNTKL